MHRGQGNLGLDLVRLRDLPKSTARAFFLRLSVVCWILSVCSVFSSDAHASVVVARSIEELSIDADAIVRAQVVGQQSVWGEESRRIYTYTELEVTESWYPENSIKGRVVVRTLGGVVGSVGMRVSGVAKFRRNEDVLLFLVKDSLNKTDYRVIGMSQGKFHVEHLAGKHVAQPNVAGLAFARRTPDGTMSVDPKEQGLKTMPLSELRERVKKALARKKVSK